ncbi:MAG: hypothetical protein NC036_04185 [Muribaculaceae bacterium]|nr:hypothetical protein [Muribaculaceae bacterium]
MTTPVRPTTSAERFRVPLMIYGNPRTNAGYNAIFYFNQPTFTPPPALSPGGMQDNDYYFIVRISEKFTNVTLIQNNVSSADGGRLGWLKLAIAVPIGMRPGGGATPYDLLVDMRNTFVNEYMEPNRGGVGYRYRDPMPGPERLQQVLDKYYYERATLPHRQMTGQGQAFLRLPESQMRALFTDLQYPEFGVFNEIVIASRGELNPNVGISEIPRRPKYKLMVNNRPMQWPVADYMNQQINIVGDKNPRYWDNTSVSFNLTEARQGRLPFVSVDEVREIVNVSINPRPKSRVLRIRIDGAPATEVANLNVSVDGRRIPVAEGRVVLKGEDIDKRPNITYTGVGYDMGGAGVNGDEIVVSLKRRERRGFTPGGDISGGGNEKPIHLNVIIDAGKKSLSYMGTKIMVERSNGYGTEIFSIHPSFRHGNNMQIPGSISAEVEVPGRFAGQARIIAKGNGGKAHLSHILKSGGTLEVRFPGSSFAKKNPLASMGGIGWAMVFSALILGAVIGWFVPTPSSIFSKEETENPEGGEGQPVVENNWFKDEQRWKEFESKLTDPNLTFEEVGQMYDALSEARENSDADEYIEKYKSIADKIEAYREAVNAIRSGSVEEVIAVGNKLNDVHRNNLVSIFKGVVTDSEVKLYTGEALEKAKSKFQAGGYASFIQLTDISDGLQTAGTHPSSSIQGYFKKVNGQSTPVASEPSAPSTQKKGEKKPSATGDNPQKHSKLKPQEDNPGDDQKSGRDHYGF